MTVSEETAKRIADSLERLERKLDGLRLPIGIAPYNPDPNFGIVEKCAICGGGHFDGLMCPALRPMAGGL